MNSNIRLTINTLYKDFTKSEKILADMVLKDAVEIANNSITNFSEKAHVGDATIVRFCRKLGFQGFQGFRMSLIRELASNENDSLLVNDEIKYEDTIELVSEKLYNSYSNAIKDSKKLLDFDTIKKVTELVLESNKIRFYGIVNSGLTAIDISNKLLRTGLNVQAFTDGHNMAIDASLLTSNDIVFAITHSGSTKDVVEALELAKKNNCKTVAITHYLKCPITKFSDYILLTAAKETPYQSGSLGQKISQLYIMDMLYTSILLSNKANAIQILEKTTEAIENKLF